MARKKRTVEKNRQIYQQREQSGQFVSKFVLAALAAAVTYWLATALFSAFNPALEQLSAAVRTYQYIPLGIGVAAALFSPWVKERIHGERSDTLYAALIAVLLTVLLVAGIYLVARAGG